VDQPVDTRGGASAYIDDYFRWRAGPSAEANLKKIQDEDIPRIEETMDGGFAQHLETIEPKPLVPYSSKLFILL
jgi:hypothetical protein